MHLTKLKLDLNFFSLVFQIPQLLSIF